MDPSSSTLVLTSGRRLLYASEATVQKNIAADQNYASVERVAGLKSSDLTAGVYEGGLKIWEGAVDLCNYIDSSLFNAEEIQGMRVLEIGCGSALPTILCLQMGAASAAVNDFNGFVLECFTRENFQMNGVPEDKWRAVAGDWSACAQQLEQGSFDLILTSETIYNESNYPALHSAMDALLSEDGRILLAAKVYYFGLGACLSTFEEFLHAQKIFTTQELWSSQSQGVPRKIIELRRMRE